MLKTVLAILIWAAFSIAAHASELLAADVANERAEAGEVLLVDVRHPDEWRQSGVGKSAHPISMHQPKFFQKLASLTEGKLNTPIALICATGVRTTWLSSELEKRGYTAVYNVNEGMMGSQSGPGWLKRGLAVKAAN